MKTPLGVVSRPLHSGVCETHSDAGLPVIHSAISDSGRLRTRGGQLCRGEAAVRRAWGERGPGGGDHPLVATSGLSPLARAGWFVVDLAARAVCAYLLGLLAMIKCSICSYQCDN